MGAGSLIMLVPVVVLLILRVLVEMLLIMWLLVVVLLIMWLLAVVLLISDHVCAGCGAPDYDGAPDHVAAG